MIFNLMKPPDAPYKMKSYLYKDMTKVRTPPEKI